jgi:glycine betaine/choline ABC-type transport system substrate-binding protein
VIETLSDGIDEPAMRRLNALVDDEGRFVRDVVAEFLRAQEWVAP